MVNESYVAHRGSRPRASVGFLFPFFLRRPRTTPAVRYLSCFLELPPSLFPPSTQVLPPSLRSSGDVRLFFLSLLLTSHRSYINDSRHVVGSLLHALETTDSLGVGSAPRMRFLALCRFSSLDQQKHHWTDREICETTCKLGKFIPSTEGN